MRKDISLDIDYNNQNRYRIVVNESDGSKTAYCFSVPIYNIKTRKSLDMNFSIDEKAFSFIGSNAHIMVSNKILIKNEDGFCSIKLKHPVYCNSKKELITGHDYIYPTTNGIMYKAFCSHENNITFELETEKYFPEIRENDRCVALMSQKFKPFATISCIGTADETGNIISPAILEYQRLTDKKYELKMHAKDPRGMWILFEANLHEEKLIQDTTVESNNPQTNNAFGTSAFIGNTSQYGEQWLYSKMNFEMLSDFADKQILKVVAHLPKHSTSNTIFDAFKVKSRFCSFGSTWFNKIPSSSFISKAIEKESNYDLDLTRFFVATNGKFSCPDGIILKPRTNNNFSAIATGDSHFSPQILEVKFK